MYCNMKQLKQSNVEVCVVENIYVEESFFYLVFLDRYW